MKRILCIGLTLLMGISMTAQTEAEKVKSTVFKKDIESHIYFLASDELKGRQTGSEELDIAAAYISNQLRKFGAKPAGTDGSFYQNVPMEKTNTPKNISININDITLDNFIALSVKNIDYSGEAVYLGYGTEEDFDSKDVKGKIVIVKAGLTDSDDMRMKYRAKKKKAKLAKKAGAAALVELLDTQDKNWKRYSHYFNEDKVKLADQNKEEGFVHLWMLDKGMVATSAIEDSKKLTSSLTIDGIKVEKMSSKNVIGYIEGSDPKLKDEFIIYSAHYDHVGIGAPNAQNDSIYNGARDNAVGTVTVLSVAENIGKYPTKRSSLFILFTGEEKGLLGSKYYAANPLLPLNKMVYCFNSDGAGYNDTSKITIFGLYRTTVSQHIIDAGKEFGLTVIDDPAPEQNLFDRSDNVNFAAKGIPAPTFSLGFTAFDAEINKYYHQASDNPDNLDYDYLTKFFKSYVLSSRMISNDPKTPFWTEGDKYYDAGIKLYNKESKNSLP